MKRLVFLMALGLTTLTSYAQINVHMQTACNPQDVKTYDTERLRSSFLMEKVMSPNEINLTYSMYDRFIFGGAMPVSKELSLDTFDALKAPYFLYIRELGVINVGGEGIVTVDGKEYTLNFKEALYVGRGNKKVTFRSKDASQPAKFYLDYNDVTVLETAILELVFHLPQEQYTLILNSLKKEVCENISYYKKGCMPDEQTVYNICFRVSEIYKEAIEEQQYKTTKLHAPLNEAYHRYDSIGYREHTAEDEKRAEMEYERCKDEYEEKKNKLTELYDLQKQTREKALQYAKSRFNEIYRLGCHLKETLAKYVFDETNEPEEPAEQEPNAPNIQEEVLGTKQTEYFNMELLSLIHVTCVGEQFENISEHDFYTCMNLLPSDTKPQIRPREKIRTCYLIFLMSEKLPKQDRENWKRNILKILDIEESYYKSKYKEPVSDFPSDSNRKFAKEMDGIFR